MTSQATLISEPKTIRLTDLTTDFISGQSGFAIGKKLDKEVLDKPKQLLHVSLEGVQSVSPSFINGAFIYLIELYGEKYFRQYVKLNNANPRVSAAVSKSLQKFIEHRKAFFQKASGQSVLVLGDGSPMVESAITFLIENNSLAKYSRTLLPATDMAIVLITDRLSKSLGVQLDSIVQTGKPLLIIAKKDIRFNSSLNDLPFVLIIGLEVGKIVQAVRNLNEALLKKKVSRDDEGFRTSIKNGEAFAFSVFALIVVELISGLFEED